MNAKFNSETTSADRIFQSFGWAEANRKVRPDRPRIGLPRRPARKAFSVRMVVLTLAALFLFASVQDFRANGGGSGLTVTGEAQPVSARDSFLAGRFSGVGARALDDAQAFLDFQQWVLRYLAASTDTERAVLSAEGETLAARREAAMVREIETQPDRALARAVPAWIRKNLPAPVALHVESWVSGRGDLLVVCVTADEHEGDAHGEDIVRRAVLDGTAYRAFVHGTRENDASAEGTLIEGVVLGGRMAVKDPPAAAVPVGPPAPAGAPAPSADAEIPASPLRGAADGTAPLAGIAGVPAAAAAGLKKVLVLRVDFPDAAGEPITTAAAKSLFDVDANAWYQEISGGRLSLTAAVTPVLRMPRTASWYSVRGADIQLLKDARNAGRAAGFDSARFDFDFVAFRRVIPRFSWSGLGLIGAKGAWLNGNFSPWVAVHELGHNLGLFHANAWVPTGESPSGAGKVSGYGNLFDAMGSGRAVNFPFNAWYQARLGWLGSNDVVTVQKSGRHRIHALEARGPLGPRALRIPNTTARDYWVEFRQAVPTNPWLSNGAGVNWGFTTNRASYLLDMTPGSAGGTRDSALPIGRTFSDLEGGIHITTVGKSSAGVSTLDVVVNLGKFPGNRPPTVILRAGAAAAAPGEAVTFTANASDADGDELAFAWDFGDGTSGANEPRALKSFGTSNTFVVRCAVTDMKGGTAAAEISFKVAPAPAPNRVAVAFDSSPRLFWISGSPWVEIRGRASSDSRILGVTFVNDANGAEGRAEGAESWKAAVPLVRGTNGIAFRAVDASGRAFTRRMEVTVAFD